MDGIWDELILTAQWAAGQFWSILVAVSEAWIALSICAKVKQYTMNQKNGAKECSEWHAAYDIR